MDDLVKYLSQSFAGRRVLVTGDTGFKGSWLTMMLLELGAQVQGYALPPERTEDHYNLLNLGKRIQHTDGDIRDLAAMRLVFDNFKPEYLFHLAAQSLVGRSYDEPKQTFDINVGGSVNVLECVRTTDSLKSVIYVTSDKCYRNKEWVWGYRENDELGGRDPYSASKAATELLFTSYVDSFFASRNGFGIASVRAGNVIGGGDWAENRIVPDCIRALREGQPIVLRNPGATRPWQHVLEPLSGYLMLAAKLASQPGDFGGSWNFGPRADAIRTVEDLARGIVDCWGGGHVLIDRSTARFDEARLLHLNCDRASFGLSWKPRWDFSRTVRETASWYLEVSSGASAVNTTRRQIMTHLESGND
jgi:CDP-glucose 4,6-dehydratase